MNKSFLIIGLGTFGIAVAKTLATLKADFMVIDKDDDAVLKVSHFTQNCSICNCTILSEMTYL